MLAVASLTIVVVDDAVDMRLLARRILEGDGIEVVAEAADGCEALERYRELNPPPVPTVILLDNMMPRMTGIEAAEQILADQPNQLVVLFSAFLSDEILEQARRLGIAACVAKTDVDRLPEIIRSLVTSAG